MAKHSHLPYVNRPGPCLLVGEACGLHFLLFLKFKCQKHNDKALFLAGNRKPYTRTRKTLAMLCFRIDKK
ncbi:hypothetical protein ALON55S_03744 [Alishewanella longhuensis]